MKIGVDLRCLQGGQKTGVEEYAFNLISELLKVDRKNEYILFFNSFGESKINSGDLSAYANVEIKMFHYPNKVLNLCFWYLGWPKIDQMLGGVDVLFLPNINFAAWSRKVKTILTVHDLSFEYYPEAFSWKRRFWHFFINSRKLAEKVDRIIAVSESTKSDLMSLYQIKKAKIRTVPSAVTLDFQVLDRNNLRLPLVAKKYQLPYKFILYLGTIEPRKNIIGLIRAYNLLRAQNDPELNKYKLVIAGAVGWKSEKIFLEIEKSAYGNDIIVTGKVNSADLPIIYNLASLFVYPSFFEGFGFPPLEAMACGLPVIVSNASSLSEIVGSAGIMIDPDKPDEIFQAMKEVLLDKELQKKMRSTSLEQAAKFSWSRTAENFLELLGDLEKTERTGHEKKSRRKA